MAADTREKEKRLKKSADRKNKKNANRKMKRLNKSSDKSTHGDTNVNVINLIFPSILTSIAAVCAIIMNMKSQEKINQLSDKVKRLQNKNNRLKKALKSSAKK